MNSFLTIRHWSLHAMKRSFTLSLSKGRLSSVLRPLFSGTVLLVASATLSPARADVPSAAALPPVDHYVHLSFLPKASELVQDAKINNLTILRIDELADRVIVSYKYPDGRTATLGYALLGTDVGKPQAVERRTAKVESTASYTVSDRDPEIIYVSRPSTTVVYSDPYPYYNTWAPLTVGFGIGWATGYYGNYYRPYYGYYGGYYGGHHHHGGGYKHGGYHGGGHRGGGSNHGGGYHSSGGYGRGSGGRGRH